MYSHRIFADHNAAEPGPAVEATSSSSWREGFLQICAVALKGH